MLEQEEIEEKLLMTPGDIVMMLNEMGGLRVQTTSPALGAASVRIQGIRGRYSRFLSGMGCHFSASKAAGWACCKFHPMDLGQVEVIKGVASALYGAGGHGRGCQSHRPASQRLSRSMKFWSFAPRSAQRTLSVFLASQLFSPILGRIAARQCRWTGARDI